MNLRFPARGSRLAEPRDAALVAGALACAPFAGLSTAVLPPDTFWYGAVSVAAAALAWWHPRTAALSILAALIIFEARDGSSIRMTQLYSPAPLGLSPALGLALLCCLSLWRRGVRPDLSWIHLPFALLASGAMLGAVKGILGGASPYLVGVQVSGIWITLLVGWLAAACITSRRDLAFTIGVVLAASTVRSALALALLSRGDGVRVRGETETLATSIDGGTNLFVVLALLMAAALVMSKSGRIDLRRFSKLGLLWGPLIGLCLAVNSLALVLSYRRSFLLGIAVGLVVILIARAVGSRQILTAVLVALALVVGVAVASFLPQGTTTTQLAEFGGNRADGDEYRLRERASVLSSLKSDPVFGLGTYTPWVPVDGLRPITGSESYVHSGPLWHWINFGLLGLIGYLGLFAATTRRAWQKSRGGAALPAAAGIGLLAALAALFVADMTAAFTTHDGRVAVCVGLVIGILSLRNTVSNGVRQ